MATRVPRRQRWLSFVVALLFIGVAIVAFIVINPINTDHQVLDASPTLTALPPTVTPTSLTGTPQP